MGSPSAVPTTTTHSSSESDKVDDSIELPFSLSIVIIAIIPVLVVFGLVMNLFAVRVLQSNFLQKLTSQPIIKNLLLLHCIMLITGPLYLWLMPVFGVFISEDQIYLCFLLRWLHNLVVLATSWLLILWMLERVFTIGRPESTWTLWRKTCSHVSILLVGAALVVTVGGVMVRTSREPAVCMPWLDINRFNEDRTWHKVFSVLFSLGPCLVMLVLLICLMSVMSLLSYRVHKISHDLSHYHSMLVEIKTAMHLKFVSSLVWIGPLFVLTCAPIGLFLFMSADQSFYAPARFYPGIRIDWGGVHFKNKSLFAEKNSDHITGENDVVDHSAQSNVRVQDIGYTGSGSSKKDGMIKTNRGGNRTVGNNNKLYEITTFGIVEKDDQRTSINISNNSHGASGNQGQNENGYGKVVQNRHGGYRNQKWNVSEHDIDLRHPKPTDRNSLLSPLRNMECLLWLIYYAFIWTVVPIMLITEPLFRRESSGKLKELKSFCCRRRRLREEQNTASSVSDREQNAEQAALNEWNKMMKLDPITNDNLETFVNEANELDEIRLRNASSGDVIEEKIAKKGKTPMKNAMSSNIDIINAINTKNQLETSEIVM